MADLNLKQHDTKPLVEAQLKYQSGQSFKLSNVQSIYFIMRSSTDNALKFNSKAEVVDAQDGRVRYVWSATDTNKAGDFNAEFQITFDDGSVLTAPSSNYIEITIEPRLV